MGNPIVWFEIMGNSGAELQAFYSTMFGWKFDMAPGTPGYGMVPCQEGSIPGGVGAAQQGPGYVTIYVGVDDAAAALALAEANGGETVVPPMVLPDGTTIGLFTDPQGQMVGVAQSAS